MGTATLLFEGCAPPFSSDLHTLRLNWELPSAYAISSHWSRWLDKKWKMKTWPEPNRSPHAKSLTATLSNLECGNGLRSDSLFLTFGPDLGCTLVAETRSHWSRGCCWPWSQPFGRRRSLVSKTKARGRE